ncbi:hypothetical protein HDV05_008077 [Chytridiales sp. JEL 0842]|nr:hypothetical protein HDV05_008077 [Chytridiales sp. JEL 0842]
MVVLRFNIMVDVIKGNWENIVKAERLICKGMETDPTFMEPDTIKLLIESILPHDFTKALNVALHFMEIIADTPNSTRFSELSALFGLLLFPTVFEEQSWIIEPSHLEKSWAEGRGNIRRAALIREYLEEEKRKKAEGGPAKGLSRGPGGLVGSVEGGGVKGRDRAGSIAGRGVGPGGRRRMSERLPAGAVGFLLEEADEGQKRRFALDGVMAKQKDVLGMVRTEVRILKALSRGVTNEELADDIIKIVTGDENLEAAGGERASLIEPKKSVTAPPATWSGSINNLNNAYKSTISSFTNRIFLDALLTTQRFEEYFHVGFELVASYNTFWFSRSALRHMELSAIPKLRGYVDKVYTVASTHLAEAIAVANKAGEGALASLGASSMNLSESSANSAGSGAPSNNPTVVLIGQSMTAGTKSLRDGLSVVARVATMLAQSVELKGVLDKDGVETVARCVGGLNAMLNQLSTSMFKILETMERMLGKTGSAGAYARDAASLTQEEIRQSCRGYSKPSEAKTRAVAATVSAATGASVRDASAAPAIMEEVYVVIDKLAKVAKANGPLASTAVPTV